MLIVVALCGCATTTARPDDAALAVDAIAHDAGPPTDDAFDAAGDAMPDAPEGDAGPVVVDVVITPASPRPTCSDWASPAAPTLPTDAPAMGAMPLFVRSLPATEVTSSALLPDGTLVLYRREAGELFRVARDGTIAWRVALPSATGTPSGALRVSPDGTTYVPLAADTGIVARAVPVTLDGTLQPTIDVDLATHPDGLSGIAFGPSGRVYLSTFEDVVETCRGGPLLARAHLVDGRGRTIRLADVAVDGSGAVLLSAYGALAVLRISDGLASSTGQAWIGLAPDTVLPGAVEVTLPLSIVGTRLLLRTTYAIPGTFHDGQVATLVRPGEAPALVPEGATFLDGLGRVVVAVPDPHGFGGIGTWEYWRDGTLEGSAPLVCEFGPHGADGSMLCLTHQTDFAVQHVAPDGTAGWSVALEPSAARGGILDLHLDVDGRLWAVLSTFADHATSIHALQSSQVPSDDLLTRR